MTPTGDTLVGHPVIALARRLGCTEGQIYTAITGIVIAILLALASVHGPTRPSAPSSPAQPAASSPEASVP